jgi:peptidyl-prolyl cis-trans isomerase SurA
MIKKTCVIIVTSAALSCGVLTACSGKSDQGDQGQAKKDQVELKESKKPEAAKKEVTKRAAVRSGNKVPAKVVKLSAKHILVMHNDSKRKPPGISRTKAEAEARIKEALEKLKGGAEFEKVVEEYSDCPSKERGGDLGIFPSTRMAPEFSRATIALEEGGVSDPVETEFGFHIIKRQKIEEVHARHILIMHDESKRKPPTISRSKKDALKLIKDLKKKLNAKDADFAVLAKEHSDCPSKSKGGDLGMFGRGRMAPPFEKSAFTLKENEISDIVETDFGYHIIQRLPN